MSTKKLFYLLALLLMGLVACSPTPAPTSTPKKVLSDRFVRLVNTIYDSSGVDMKWEKIPSEGFNLPAWNWPNRNVYEIKGVNEKVTIKHLITGEYSEFIPYDEPAYSMVPFVFKDPNSKRVGWSGFILVQLRSDGVWIEKSLVMMTDEQLLDTMDKLDELINLWELEQQS